MPGANRFPPLDIASLGGLQKDVAEQILGFSLNGLGGPFNALLRSPEATRAILQLSDYLRFRAAVPDRLMELAILVHARIWSDNYEWALHHGRAAKAGLSVDVIEDIRNGRVPRNMKDDESAVFAYCTEFAQTRAVSDEVFFRAKSVLNEQGIVDLTIALAQYVMISMILNMSKAPLPPGAMPQLEPVEAPFAHSLR